MTLFVAKSSLVRTQVPRRVTGRLTVRRLVNINPGCPRTLSTVAPRKPQHQRLRSPRSESKSFFFLKQAHGDKRAIQEAGEGGGVAAPPTEPKNVLPPPLAEPEEVPPPRRKVPRQAVAAVRAPALNAQDAPWSVKLLHEAFVNLGKVVVHLGVEPPSHPLQTTVMDYTFMVNVLVGDLERGVLRPPGQRR
jgi:hypothetical protein